MYRYRCRLGTTCNDIIVIINEKYTHVSFGVLKYYLKMYTDSNNDMWQHCHVYIKLAFTIR